MAATAGAGPVGATGGGLTVAAVLAAALVGLAVLVWPARARPWVAPLDARSAGPRTGPGPGTPAAGAVDQGELTDAGIWQQDPIDLYRRWRLRRRPAVLVDDVLDLLRGVGPALGAGLAPSRAIELAATSSLGAERVRAARAEATRRAGGSTGATRKTRTTRTTRTPRTPRATRGSGPARAAHEAGGPQDPKAGPGGRWVRRLATRPTAPRADIDRLVGALLAASDRAQPTSPVWAEWAARSASAELALVAAAWRLSETTGAPLAAAVERAVRGLLDARARNRKVAVAVAGPRATVTVLTLLPLTGPLFGVACGIDPATLYLGSPIASACVVLGVALVWLGRAWCTRMVRTAVRA